MLLTRSPLGPHPKARTSFDLHVLGTPPAFILSQDQTLRKIFHHIRRCGSGQLTSPNFVVASYHYSVVKVLRASRQPRRRPRRNTPTRTSRIGSLVDRAGPIVPGPWSLTALNCPGLPSVVGETAVQVLASIIVAAGWECQGWPPGPAGRGLLQISWRPCKASVRVRLSAYSTSPPAGRPRASRVRRTGVPARISFKYIAVASPSRVGLVARISS